MSESHSKTASLRNNKFTILTIFLIVLVLTFLITVLSKSSNPFTARVEAASACPTAVYYGTSTVSTNVKVAGTYNVWSRLQIPVANNSFYIKIDSTCYKVVGTNLPLNKWGWIGFENGSSGSPIKQDLQVGDHTIAIISSEPNVKVDRLILTTGSCVPKADGLGDECAVPVDSPPTVTIDTPANGATITGVARVAATAVDDTQITKVDFSIDSSATPFKSITAPPYSFDWDPTSLTSGQHKLSAKAYDSVGQTATATVTLDVQIAPPPPSGTAYVAVPANNDLVSGKDVILSAGTSNLNNVSKVEFLLDDNLNLGSAAPTIQFGWILHWDSTLVANGQHKLAARATAGSTVVVSSPIMVTVSNSGDNVRPTMPGNIRLDKPPTKTQAKVVWDPSTDNQGGIIRYFTYLNDQFKSRQRDTSKTYFDLNKGTTYVAKIVAVDETGNQSLPATLTFKTKSFCITAGVCVW